VSVTGVARHEEEGKERDVSWGGGIPDELVGALVPKQADGLAIHRSNNLILTDGDHCLLHSCHLA